MQNRIDMRRGNAIFGSIATSFLISYIVFKVNQNFGNSFNVCFNISLLLFFNICFAFFAYFLIRDMFSTRWGGIKEQTDLISTKAGWIPLHELENGQIRTNLEKSLNPFENLDPNLPYINKLKQSDIIEKRNPCYLRYEFIFPKLSNEVCHRKELIIFLHGMKRNAKYIRYLTHSLALNGSIVFTYSARTTKAQLNQTKAIHNSKDNKGFFIREDDFEVILNFFLAHPLYKDYKIDIIAESIGAMTAVGVLFKKDYFKKVNKLILISLPSIFNKILRKHLIPFSRSWVIRFNYLMKGIHIYPKEPVNSELSPFNIFKKYKQKYELENHQISWSEFIDNKLILVHSKTDGLFKIRNFWENKNILNLSHNNIVIFNQGGHNQIRNELAIISIARNFFNS